MNNTQQNGHGDIMGRVVYRMHLLCRWLCRTIDSPVARLLAWMKGVHVGRGLQCQGIPYWHRLPDSTITLGNDCRIWSAYRSNNIGSMSRSRIATESRRARIIIGHRVGMSAVTIVSHEAITIDDDTMIGAGTVISDCDWHSLSPDVTTRHTVLGRTAPISIGRNAFIGTRCIILKGVTIGPDAVIGAGSVVTSDIPAGVVAAGNPCRVISQLHT